MSAHYLGGQNFFNKPTPVYGWDTISFVFSSLSMLAPSSTLPNLYTTHPTVHDSLPWWLDWIA